MLHYTTIWETPCQEIMNLYLERKLSKSGRRILIAKWVVNSWSKIKTSLKDIIVRSSSKCGGDLTIRYVRRPPNQHPWSWDYQIPATEKAFHLLTDEESEDRSVKSEMNHNQGNTHENYRSSHWKCFDHFKWKNVFRKNYASSVFFLLKLFLKLR